MLDFALSFATQHTFLFYSLVLIALLLEGPIVIFTLTALSWPLQIPLWMIFILAVFGDAGGDILHFLAGKYTKNLISKIPFFTKIQIKNQTFLSFYKKIHNYPLLEKLIIIKYTPPITSAWLLYLGSSGLNFYRFLKSTLPLCFFSSIIVVTIWVFFSTRTSFSNHIEFVLFSLGVGIFLLTKGLKRLWNYLVNSIKKKHQN